MYLPVVMTVMGLWAVGGLASDFTINSIELIASTTKLKNGDPLELKCAVKFAKTTDFVLHSNFTFYMNDKVLHTISSIEDEVSYTILQVRVSHTSPYRCAVSVGDWKKSSEEVKIEVTGLSSPLISVSKNQTSEGEDVSVTCSAAEEWKYKSFTFYKINSKTGKEKKEETKEKETLDSYTSVAFTIREGEEILQFKCTVQLLSRPEISPDSEILTATVVAPFSVPRIEVSPSLNFTEGENMTVKCSVQKGRARSDDMKLTLQKERHIINSSNTTTLSYSRVATVDDRGNYTCKVESEKTAKSSSAKIDIAELFPRPQLKLKRTTSTQYISDNEFITLICSVAGQTLNVQYKFIVNGGPRILRSKTGKLPMTVSERFSGSYVCQVTIANITKNSEPLDIQVYAPVQNPVLTHIMGSNQTVVLGDTLELTCRCQAGTPPITYYLLRGNEILENKTMEGEKEARFLVNSSHDLGQYRCQATNRNTQSTSKYSNIVNVTVIVPISKVNLTIIPSHGDVEEGSEMTLICQAVNGTLPIEFAFYRTKEKKLLLQSVTEQYHHFATHNVTGFSKQDDGHYFCTASNGARKEVSSSKTTARAVLATWKKAVIGTFVFLIILVAIAICAYLHIDKKKRGKDISGGRSKPVATNSKKPAVEAKEADYGTIKTEEELHILKTPEDNPGNNQPHHKAEADGDSAEAHPESAENSVNRTEDAPDADSHPR